MKLPASKFAKVAAFVSIFAGIGYVAHVVVREVTYVHTKISRSPGTDIARQDIRWTEEAAGLPGLRVSFLETNDQLDADTWQK